MIFYCFLMTIDPTHHIYNIQLTENVFQWNLFISKFSSAAPISARRSCCQEVVPWAINASSRARVTEKATLLGSLTPTQSLTRALPLLTLTMAIRSRSLQTWLLNPFIPNVTLVVTSMSCWMRLLTTNVLPWQFDLQTRKWCMPTAGSTWSAQPFGWQLCYQLKDGSLPWEILIDLKESHPIETAKYAKIIGIDHEPAFNWWVPHVLKKRNQIILLVKKQNPQFLKWTHKFGI